MQEGRKKSRKYDIHTYKPEYMVSRVQVSEGLLYTWHKTLAPTLDNLITFFHLEFGQKWTYCLDSDRRRF